MVLNPRRLPSSQHFDIIKINWLMLFRGIISVNSHDHAKQVNTLCAQNDDLLNVKAGGADTTVLYRADWVFGQRS
jgi:hypothetical protein